MYTSYLTTLMLIQQQYKCKHRASFLCYPHQSLFQQQTHIYLYLMLGSLREAAEETRSILLARKRAPVDRCVKFESTRRLDFTPS